jgi:hypothetical protein
MVSTGNGSYNYQGVKGTARTFSAGERIVVTWYNNSASPITFTPKISFNDSDRIGSGATGAWYDMTPLTLAVNGTGTTQYVVTAGSAGSYALVNINCNYTNDQLLICDKIELWTGASAVEAALPPGARISSFNASPNPFNSGVTFSWDPAFGGEKIMVVIFDVKGRAVDALTPSSRGKSPGRVSVTWEAKGMTSGVYIARMVSNSRWMQSGKIMLIR